MVSAHSSGARALGSIMLFFALGSLVVAAPTPTQGGLITRSEDLYNAGGESVTLESPEEEFLVARAKTPKPPKTPKTPTTPKTSAVPVKDQTGYDTYQAFMDASAAYHKVTDDIYGPAAVKANTAWAALGRYQTGDLSGLRADQKQEASRLATTAEPLVKAAMEGAKQVQEARQAAVTKYGEKLLQEGNMKYPSHQNHIDTAATWATNVAQWNSKLTIIAKLKRAA